MSKGHMDRPSVQEKWDAGYGNIDWRKKDARTTEDTDREISEARQLVSEDATRRADDDTGRADDAVRND